MNRESKREREGREREGEEEEGEAGERWELIYHDLETIIHFLRGVICEGHSHLKVM